MGYHLYLRSCTYGTYDMVGSSYVTGVSSAPFVRRTDGHQPWQQDLKSLLVAALLGCTHVEIYSGEKLHPKLRWIFLLLWLRYWYILVGMVSQGRA